MEIFTVPALTSLSMEGLKYLIRWIKKNPTYDPPAEFYAAWLSLLTLAWQIIFGYAGYAEMPALDLMSVLSLVANALGSVMVYVLGIKPLKEYKRYNS